MILKVITQEGSSRHFSVENCVTVNQTPWHSVLNRVLELNSPPLLCQNKCLKIASTKFLTSWWISELLRGQSTFGTFMAQILLDHIHRWQTWVRERVDKGQRIRKEKVRQRYWELVGELRTLTIRESGIRWAIFFLHMVLKIRDN